MKAWAFLFGFMELLLYILAILVAIPIAFAIGIYFITPMLVYLFYLLMYLVDKVVYIALLPIRFIIKLIINLHK